jgi:hypothetical protein
MAHHYLRDGVGLRSNLRLAASSEQLGAGDETGVVGRKKPRCASRW